jgi:DNA-binding XRE family transcriptional regulator
MSRALSPVTSLPFEVEQMARLVGAHVITARLRRNMTQDELADSVGIARKTLYRLESGAPVTSVGTLFAVLWKLGLLEGAQTLAHPDQDDHGKILAAAKLPGRARKSNPKIDLDF